MKKENTMPRITKHHSIAEKSALADEFQTMYGSILEAGKEANGLRCSSSRILQKKLGWELIKELIYRPFHINVYRRHSNLPAALELSRMAFCIITPQDSDAIGVVLDLGNANVLSLRDKRGKTLGQLRAATWGAMAPLFYGKGARVEKVYSGDVCCEIKYADTQCAFTTEGYRKLASEITLIVQSVRKKIGDNSSLQEQMMQLSRSFEKQIELCQSLTGQKKMTGNSLADKTGFFANASSPSSYASSYTSSASDMSSQGGALLHGDDVDMDVFGFSPH